MCHPLIELRPCAACGYVEHDIPTRADDAHQELCCGSRGDCFWKDDKRYLCITHDPLTKNERIVEVHYV